MRVNHESELQNNVFEYYYALGKGRSLGKVAEKFEVKLSTVEHWSNYFGWRDRIMDRQNEIARELARDIIRDAVKDRKEYREFIKSLINKGVERFNNEKLEPETISDVVALIKADIALTANTGEMVEQVGAGGRTIIRELSMEEILGGGNGFDVRLARRISETIVEHSKRPVTGDGGPDEPGGMAESQEGISE